MAVGIEHVDHKHRGVTHDGGIPRPADLTQGVRRMCVELSKRTLIEISDYLPKQELITLRTNGIHKSERDVGIVACYVTHPPGVLASEFNGIHTGGDDHRRRSSPTRKARLWDSNLRTATVKRTITTNRLNGLSRMVF
jgi:hypothetical protein